MTERYALIGHPVAHSLSPRIHAAFGEQIGLPVHYGLITSLRRRSPARSPLSPKRAGLA